MSALVPCECGRIPTILRRKRLRSGRFEVDELWVECTPCGARGSTYHPDDQPAAIAAWNQRTTPAELATLHAELARLRRAINNAADAIENADPDILTLLWMPETVSPNETVVEHLRTALHRRRR
jgi:predicted  nucleic acid-binding Zn-ribbon protein